MKTIYKFVLRSYAGPMVLTFFIVMFVLVMQFMWRYIEDLVGKGLGVGVILEFMGYASITTIPMGLPLATLLAAIMTLGNLGENYELLAMKSAGMSLQRITRPLLVIIFAVAIGSFFVANNLMPWAMRRTFALIYDINHQKQSIEFKDGIFFNGIENMSIRIDHQHPETKLLTGVLIYDTRDANGDMTTTLADSGYIGLSDDKKYLKITLFHGEVYEQTRSYQWWEAAKITRHIFEKQEGNIALAGFDFERTDNELFSTGQTKNIAQLTHDIDSLNHRNDSLSLTGYEPLLRNLFINDTSRILPTSDSLRAISAARRRMVMAADSVREMDLRQRRTLYQQARNFANSSRSMLSFDETSAKDTLDQLYRHQVEWHRKISLPVSILIFFLIGASLGAIIRKGGLGMPIVVSVVFFVIYYIISITGEKLAREGTWPAWAGMWLSTFILAPLSVFLTWKATNDSTLFNLDAYLAPFRKLIKVFKRNGKKQPA